MKILERNTNEIMSIEDAQKNDKTIKATLNPIEYFPFEFVEQNDLRPSPAYYDIDDSDDLEDPDYPKGSYGYSDYYYRKRRISPEFYEDYDMLYEE